MRGGGQDWKSPCTEGTLHGEVQYIMDNGHIGSYPEQNYTHDSKHYLPTTLLAGGDETYRTVLDELWVNYYIDVHWRTLRWGVFGVDRLINSIRVTSPSYIDHIVQATRCVNYRARSPGIDDEQLVRTVEWAKYSSNVNTRGVHHLNSKRCISVVPQVGQWLLKTFLKDFLHSFF